MVQVRNVELRDHPIGHTGILASLREVAKAIRDGRLHEDVISWSGHQLVAAGSPSGNLTRAKALFDAFRKQYAYMHDQRGVERIAGAHLTLGNGKDKKPRFPGGDCDDATVAFGAACESAGIPCAVVGAGYDTERNISHVLLLVSDANGKWVYADPSAKGFEFGQYKTPTREIIVDVLSGEVLCDDTMCSPRMAGRILNDDAAGSKFLALNGIETFELEAGPQPPSSLGTLEAEGYVGDLNADDIAYIKSLMQATRDAGESLIKSVSVANDVIKSLGNLPLLGSENNPIFGPEDFQRARNLDQMLMITEAAFDSVLQGKRKIGLVNGVFGADLVLEALPSDPLLVGYDVKLRRPELYDASTSQRVNMQGSNLGAFPILGVAIAAAVATVAIAGAVIADAMASAQKAQAAAQQAANQAEYDLVKAGRTDELVKVMEARKKLMAEQAKVTPGGQVKEGAQGVAKVMETLGWIGLGGVLVWGGIKIAKSLK